MSMMLKRIKYIEFESKLDSFVKKGSWFGIIISGAIFLYHIVRALI